MGKLSAKRRPSKAATAPIPRHVQLLDELRALGPRLLPWDVFFAITGRSIDDCKNDPRLTHAGVVFDAAVTAARSDEPAARRRIRRLFDVWMREESQDEQIRRFVAAIDEALAMWSRGLKGLAHSQIEHEVFQNSRITISTPEEPEYRDAMSDETFTELFELATSKAKVGSKARSVHGMAARLMVRFQMFGYRANPRHSPAHQHRRARDVIRQAVRREKKGDERRAPF